MYRCNLVQTPVAAVTATPFAPPGRAGSVGVMLNTRLEAHPPLRFHPARDLDAGTLCERLADDYRRLYDAVVAQDCRAATTALQALVGTSDELLRWTRRERGRRALNAFRFRCRELAVARALSERLAGSHGDETPCDDLFAEADLTVFGVEAGALPLDAFALRLSVRHPDGQCEQVVEVLSFARRLVAAWQEFVRAAEGSVVTAGDPRGAEPAVRPALG